MAFLKEKNRIFYRFFSFRKNISKFEDRTDIFHPQFFAI